MRIGRDTGRRRPASLDTGDAFGVYPTAGSRPRTRWSLESTLDSCDCSDELVPPATLWLPDELRSEILDHLRAAAPIEGVGLLAVIPETRDGTAVATRYYRGTNRDASATRYTMPPDEVLAALLEMEERGWRLGAIVHSHPAGPATPSPTDRREYRYPEALMIVVSLAGDSPDLRAWWFGDRAAPWPAEVPVVGASRDAPAVRREET